MMLEDIARIYGMGADYYDNIGNKIYELTQATEAPDNSEELLVPVKDVYVEDGKTKGKLAGYARMRKVG